MLTLRCCLQILALVLLGVVCACGLPSVPEYSDERFQSLNYRDDSDALPTDPRKPVREDGLGSLLLKNLRFRDIPRFYRQITPMSWMMGRTNVNKAHLRSMISPQQEASKDISKRSEAVNQLAALLNNLKVRNIDDGVKLQSLRFGKKR